MPSTDATERVLKTTYQKWLEGFSDETEEDHPILASLRAKGNIDGTGSGVHFQESIKYKRLRLEGYADMDRLQWARKNLYQVQQHEWRALQLTDAISTKEMRQNKGMEARVKLFTDKLTQMRSDAEDDLGKFLYLDGQAAGNEKKLEGIMTLLHHANVTAAATSAMVSPADNPGGLYGGLSQVLGAFGGVGNPATRGSDDPEWEFWSQIVVSSLFDFAAGTGATANPWKDNAEEALGLAITQAIRGNNKSHYLDLFTTSRANYAILKDNQRGQQRVIVDPGPDRSLLVSKGFKGVMMVDGVDVIVDTDVPTLDASGNNLRAVGWNFSKSKMCLLPEKAGATEFWNDSGSFFDPDDKSFKWWLGLWGNLVFKPRYQVLVADVAIAT